MSRRRLGIVVGWAAPVLAVAACGYAFRGNLPDHIQTIAVPVFANRTAQPAVENTVTRAIVDAFSTNGRLRVVSADRADSILEGEVTGYELLSIAFDSAANVRAYRLVLTMNLRYRDVREKKLVFQRTGFRDQADFRVQGTVSETLVSEDAALRAAALEIAGHVVSLTLDRF